MSKPASKLVHETAPHEFPYWPFSCLNFYSHLARDFDRSAGSLAQAKDGADALRAETNLGLGVYHDLMQAYYDLALAPFTAVMNILAAPTTKTAAKD